MAEWLDAQLSDLIDIKHGFAFKGEFFTDEPTGDILVTPGNFAIGGGFQLNKPKFYNGPVPKEYVLNPGDVIVTMTDLSKQADTLGFSAVVPAIKPRLLHNQRIGRVIVKDASANLSFIAWLMRTRPYRHEIVGGATGSTVKHTSPGRILAHRFKLPSLKEQQDIVDVLQPLEDKIELNRLMNETLEGMAQAIFRDWFAEFGPVRRKAAGETNPVAVMGGLTPDPARAAELAAIFPAAFGNDGLPVGWSRRTVESIMELAYGKALPKTVRKDGPYPVYGSGGISGTHNTPLASGPGIIVGRKGTVGSLYWEAGGFFAIDTVFYVVPKDGVQLNFAWYLLQTLGLENMNTDAAVPGLNRGNAYRLEFAYGGAPLLEAFEALVGPLRARQDASNAETRTLAETRDYLLPRLMSGAVRVVPKAEAD